MATISGTNVKDTLHGCSTGDVVIENAYDDTVRSSVTFALGAKIARLTLPVAVLVVVCIALSGLNAARAQADMGTEIVSLASEKCLDVADASTMPGADVNQFRCHEGANQKWVIRNAGGPGEVAIVNQNSGLCLDVRVGGAKSGTLQQYTCHSGDNQLFRFEQRADSLRGIRIVAKHSGQCLDVPAPGLDDRLNIQQHPCHLGANQRWVHADPGPYRFPVTATPIGRHSLTLQAGRAYRFELSQLPAGVIPFIHLWREGHGNVTPLGQGLVLPQAALSHRVPAGSGGRYTLLVHAPPGIAGGTAQLTIRRDGAILEQLPNFPFGGTVIDVPRSTASAQFRYETAVPPGGVPDTFMLALNELNYLLRFDDNGGVGRASMIDALAGVSKIVVGTVNGTTGPTILYANDVFRDFDGDGLGYGLEREIGTCDLRQVQRHCNAVFNLQDTDRDGIEDGFEVFGVKDGNLYFPTWGANPLHKDLFVQADWTDEFPQTPLNQARIRRMQYHLAHGPAAHLDNPDGVDGIALHVDAGIAPTDPADHTLYGAWGGGGQRIGTTLAPDGQRLAGPAPWGTFDARRRFYFRQLLLVRGGGQNGFGQYWYATGTDSDTIMHEFGHSVGLEHEGVVRGPDGPVIKGLNCSPAYPSIMSYATPHATFLTGDGFPPEGINPSSLCEADGLGSQVSDLSFITDSLGLQVDSLQGRIDWNRDRRYSGATGPSTTSRCTPAQRVRAVVNWGPSGCDAHTQGAFALSPQTARGGRHDGGDVLGGPAITRAGSRLYVFYVKRDASTLPGVNVSPRLFYQAADIGAKATAGCPHGFRVRSNGDADPCLQFKGPFEIEVFQTASGGPGAPIHPSRATVFSQNGSVQFAIADTAGRIWTFALTVADLEADRDSQSAFARPVLPPAPGSVIRSRSDLSFIEIGLDRAKYGGTGHHLALYYVDLGAVRWASKEIGSTGDFVDRGPVIDATGAPLVTTVGDSPAVASWTALGKFDDLELYMVLQRADASFKLYAFDRTNDSWRDVTQSTFGRPAVAGPGHNQKIAFWFQHLLDGSGEIIERGKGFFSILFRSGQDAVPRMVRLGNVDRAQPPSHGLQSAAFQKFGYDWYGVRDNNAPLGLGGGFAVYSDETMPGVKAALVKLNDHNGEYDLHFLPFADGIFDMAFKPSPDFKVMEATLCRAMRGAAFCGNPQQTKWGF